MRQLISKHIYDKKDGNGPPSANQGFSAAEPKHSHAVCTLHVHPPTSPCPKLSAHTGHCCDIKKPKSHVRHMMSLGRKRLP